MSAMLFVFMGRPGAGKGVQSELLSKKLDCSIFSTGGRVRHIAKQPTALGKKIAEISNAGGLTPFWFASFLFEEALFTLSDDESMIFEGVGRKLPEAKLFAEINSWLGRDFRIINLEASEATVTERLKKRREKEGREDDAGDKLLTRFENFNLETAPSLEFFRSLGKVIDVDGEPLPDIVFAEVCKKLSLE
jgi:adenylate kinase